MWILCLIESPRPFAPVRSSLASGLRQSLLRCLLLACAVGCLLLSLAVTVPAQRAHKPAPPAPAASRATGALKVITGHPGSIVFINGVRHGTTNDKGELDLPHVRVGSYPVRVRTQVYEDWNGSVVIAAGASRTLTVTQLREKDLGVLSYQNGDALRDKGKNKEAVDGYKAALALQPNLVEARIGMARCLITLQDFQESEKQIQLAIKARGRTLTDAQTVLGNLRRQQGLLDEAAEEYRKAIRAAQGNTFEAHIGLAIALNEMNDPKLIDTIAREYRTGILQDMETEPVLYYQLGEILEKAGRNKEAIAAYKDYLRLDPEGEYASAAESVIEQLKENNNQQ